MKRMWSRVITLVRNDHRVSRSLVIAFGALGATVACFGQIPAPPQFTSELPQDVQARFPTIWVAPGISAMTIGLQSLLIPAAGMHVLGGHVHTHMPPFEGPQPFPGTIIHPPVTGTPIFPFPGTVIDPGHGHHVLPPFPGTVINPGGPILPFPGTVINPPVTGTLPFPGTVINPNPPVTGTLPFPGTVVKPPIVIGPLPPVRLPPFPGTVVYFPHGHGINHGHDKDIDPLPIVDPPFPGTVINPGPPIQPFPGTAINPGGPILPFPGTVINPGGPILPFPGTVINSNGGS
jgi:hypothetical protein